MSNEGIVMSDRDNFEAWHKANFRSELGYAKWSTSDGYREDEVNLMWIGYKAALEHCKQAEPVGFVTPETFNQLNDFKWREIRNNPANLWTANNPPSRATVPLFAHVMPKSEGKPVACTYCETGTWQGNLCTECSGTGFTTPQPTTDISELEKVEKRLNFMIDETCWIQSTKTDVGGVAYQLWTQNEDEEFYTLHENTQFFKTPREAIDAAIITKNTVKA